VRSTQTDPRDPKEREETTGAKAVTEAREEQLVRETPKELPELKRRTRGVMNNVTSEESKIQKTAERPHDR
jgi:hypothetical protein